MAVSSYPAEMVVISTVYAFWSLTHCGLWWHRSGSTLAQVMACCLTAPSHYLNQCWLHLRAISKEVFMNIICYIHLKITLNLLPHHPEVNEFMVIYDRSTKQSMGVYFSTKSYTGCIAFIIKMYYNAASSFFQFSIIDDTSTQSPELIRSAKSWYHLENTILVQDQYHMISSNTFLERKSYFDKISIIWHYQIHFLQRRSYFDSNITWTSSSRVYWNIYITRSQMF